LADAFVSSLNQTRQQEVTRTIESSSNSATPTRLSPNSWTASTAGPSGSVLVPAEPLCSSNWIGPRSNHCPPGATSWQSFSTEWSFRKRRFPSLMRGPLLYMEPDGSVSGAVRFMSSADQIRTGALTHTALTHHLRHLWELWPPAADRLSRHERHTALLL
jgi:hypothetical protein